jgi:release factor glutamine methyltransferase
MTIQQFKKDSISMLSGKSPSANLDVQVLMEFALNCSKTQLLLRKDDEIPAEKLKWLEKAIEKRITGLPVAYITGHKEFYGFDFLVSPAVLIPKPDTEILVERALELILESMELHPERILTICDMCAGSGCIGLAVLKTLAETYEINGDRLPKVTFADISGAALEVAEKNFVHLFGNSGAPADLLRSKIAFVRTNLFEAVPYKFDFILTNPPYIPHSLVNSLLQDGRNEPRLALDGDITLTGDRAYTPDGTEYDDGLEIIRNLLPQIQEHLNPYGSFLMETGEYNAQETEQLARKLGFRTNIIKDLEGQLRVVEGTV